MARDRRAARAAAENADPGRTADDIERVDEGAGDDEPHGDAQEPETSSDTGLIAELERLRAENAALKAGRGPGAELAGRKCRVELKHGPTAVVQCNPGEHPFEAFKRVTGVISSEHSPVIHEAAADERCGVCDASGKVPEPRE